MTLKHGFVLRGSVFCNFRTNPSLNMIEGDKTDGRKYTNLMFRVRETLGNTNYLKKLNI